MMSKVKTLVLLAVSLVLFIASCDGSTPAPTAPPAVTAPVAAATAAPTGLSPADTPLPSAPLVEEDEQPIEPEMVLIPAGESTMGSDPSDDPDTVDDEQPQHSLYLPDYYLAKTTVTNAEYAAFVQATGHRAPYSWQGGKPPHGKEDHPVVNVSWHDAVAYCNWLAEVSGKPYRLPSEAEWEKGARGTDGRTYPWGSRWDAARCNGRESTPGDTTPVGAYPDGASPYGALDMAGNVWEWTISVYETYPYDPADGREDLEAEGNLHRVVRGGSFGNLPWRVRCAFRGRDVPGASFWDRGFRVALDAGQSPTSSD